ncbi:WD40-repeat-containing domain protein [Leucosporidium creatinivorum]|uniref:WD40 repeat-containing protein SMU1 n=1 Tax=Leucosporidium creatinivorum TaxID=106004 RepID=A0A1Y2G1L4_9BASI|nr:WD40-repeat-containing domain protein [Leucosporidium creatinivorum]
MDDEGNSTPRPSKSKVILPNLGHELPNPLRFDSYAQPGPSNLSSRVPSTASSVAGSVVNHPARKPLTRRQQLLQRARAHENAGSPLSGIGSEALQSQNPQIKEDILRLIEQYLGEEGYLATKLVLHDEANLKAKERGDRQVQGKNLKRAIMEGDWAEVDLIVSKGPLVRTQNALLYSLYKQQFLEHIEYRELQKAFTLLNKRLKPLEHFQPTPNEFKDLCYLLSAKSVHDAPSFKNWEGVTAARERLVEAFGKMVEGEREEREENVFVPPNRLVTMLEQAVSYQIELSRYRPKDVPVIHSLLQDYTPFVVPNSIANVLEGHTANIKAVRFMGAEGKQLVSGSSDNTVRIWDTSTSNCTTIMRGHRSRIWDVDATTNGDRIASASGDRTVKVWNWQAEEELQRCATTLEGNLGDVYAARWHPMGNHIATGGYDKIVRLFDVESGTILKTFTGHSLSISSVMFNPLGNLIVSGSKDSNVRFWDSVSGLCIRTLNAQLGEVTSVDMSDSYLLTNSRDNSVRLWDVRMLRPLRRFKAHSNTSQNFIRASFAHSSLLVSGSEDGVLYMWDRESSEVLQTLEGHDGIVYGAVWNDKQSLLASYGSDAKIRTWEFDERKDFEFED